MRRAHSGINPTQRVGGRLFIMRDNTWTDLGAKNGPGNPWVGAMDLDPEHNVFVLFSFKDKQVWAYRHKVVKDGKVK